MVRDTSMKIEVVIQDEVMQFKQMDGFKDGIYEIEIKKLDTRTNQQNRAYHLWLTQIANRLNHDNITTQQIISPNIVWSGEKVKQIFTAPLIKTMFGVNSSAKLEKHNFDTLINVMTKAFGERGVQLPAFPTMKDKENNNERH